MMKRVLAFLMCTIMVVAGLPLSPLADYVNFASVTASAAETESRVVISPDSLQLYTGAVKQLSATYYEGDSIVTDGVTFSWSSNNTSVVSVSSDGTVTALSEGITSINLVASCGSKTAFASCTVNVASFVPVTSLTPYPSDKASLTQKTSLELKAAFEPHNPSNPTLEWTSSDENILEITNTRTDTGTSLACATVYGKNAGTAKVKYRTTDGSDISGEFTVTVLPLVSSLTLPPYVVITMDSKGVTVPYTVTPSNAGNQKLKWQSLDKTKCTVGGETGVLTPVAPGECIVGAATTDGSSLGSNTTVIISDGTRNITLDKTSLTLEVGDGGADLTASCTAASFNYTDAVAWSSTNPSVATVSATGLVEGVNPGETVIKATALDGSGVSASCFVKVAQPVTGIKLPETAICWVDGTSTVTPEFLPANASEEYKTVKWHSENTDIATVDENTGIISGKAVGIATIVVTTADGKYKAECKVSVEIPPESVSVGEAAINLKVGSETDSSKALTYTVYPENATNKNVKWTSSDETVATVDENGVVTAVAGGTATIICTTATAGRKDSCIVTVYEDETAVNITNVPSAPLFVTQTYFMRAEVTPATASDKTVTWSSGDENILRVNANTGLVTALAAGEAEIIATTKTGITATCTVFVVPKTDVTGIILNKTNAYVYREDGVGFTLVATVTPSNASNKAVIWSSNNHSVASVNSSGVVTCYKAGTAVITAETVDGQYSAHCIVTVAERVTGVTVNKTSTSININASETLSVTVTPSNATDKSVTWSSSDPTVATVTQSGVVTAKKAGTAVITATTNDGSFSSSCTVTAVVPVRGIRLNATSVTLPKGETTMVTTTITPVDATNQQLIWTSSDTAIATVSATGLIKGVRTGDATITVSTKDGNYKASMDLKVIQATTSVNITYSSINLDAGKKKTLEATVKPLTATDKTVKWKSSNTKVATVSNKGVVTAVAPGTATITCSATDGYSSTTCKVTVTQPVTGIKFSAKKVTVKIGTPKTLNPTIMPATASNKNLIWKTSDKKVATVSEKGVVTGVKKGTAKITATTANGLYSATITVNVTKPVSKVTLNKTSITIAVGKTTTIKATVKPSSATNKAVTWSSSDNDVLKVNSEGKITAKSAGYAVVTCTSKDGKKKATCSVFVNQPVKSVKLNKKTVNMDVNDKLTLKATVSPSTASNKALKWTSDDKRVVKVTSKGVLKPVAPGVATVTVTSIDGGYKASCKVYVVRKVKSVTLPSSLTVFLGEKGKLNAVLDPVNPTVSKITWTSSKKSVATVNKNGVITPKKLGTTTIKVKTADGGFTDTCKVTVKRAIKSLKLKKKNVTLNVGASFTLKTVKKPSNATEAITWKSSNKNVATVNKQGVISAKGRGTAVITGTTEKGLTVKCNVTVNQPVTSMYISKASAAVYIGDTLKLSANVLPKNANNQSFTWSSSNSAVASVSGGTVTPKSTGTAVITVKSANGKTASCSVTVKQHVTSVTLDKASVSIIKNETCTLKASVLPATASEKGYTFTSSDTSVATVTAQGVVTAKNAGTAVITLRSKENNKTASCKVTVIEKVESVSVNSAAETLDVGESYTLKATVLPATASNKAVTWKSSDTSVAEVSSSGVITAKKSGVALITVTTVDGSFTARCSVTVLQHATGVTLDESITINKGAQKKITATVLPEDSFNKNIIWDIEHEEIATISEYGMVTGTAVGKTVITATTVDGGHRAQCIVYVNEPVTGISLDTEEITGLYKGQTYTLTPTVYPDEYEGEHINRDIIWTSSDESIATVENGVITAVGKGNAVITATTVDGGFEDSCNVRCLIPVEEIATDKDVYYVPLNSEVEISASVLPEDADYPEVTWEITEGAEAGYFTLNEGRITPVSIGYGKVTVTSVDNPQVSKTVEVHIVQNVTGIELDIASKTINKGESCTLVPTVKPSNAYNKNVTYSSDNEEVVSVDETGNVTAVGKGEATVTVTTEDGGKTASCTFTVKQLAEEITFPESEYAIGKGKSITLEATVLPENTDDKSLSWTTSDSGIATVIDGNVTAVGTGEAVITATATDSGKVYASVKVTVTQHAEEIILESSADELWVGESAEITATVNPEDTTDKTVIWSSSDEAVATVDENGKVTAIGADAVTGISTVTITALSACKSVSAQYELTVKQQVTSIETKEETVVLRLGETFTLEAQVLPENAFSKAITWSSADENIAFVDENGTVTAQGTGTVTITATSACGKAQKQCSVKVIVLPEGIEMEENISLEKTKTHQLTAKLTPDNVTETAITWSSDNEEVATVDENGLVTAVKAGSAIITAQTEVEGLYAQCSVTVFVNSEKINLNYNEYEFYIGEEAELIAKVLPEDTTNKNVKWTTSDENVVTVDENGKIKAVDKGTAEITVTAEDTGVTATCKVTVKKHVESIALPEAETVAYVGRTLKLQAVITPEDATNKSIIWTVSNPRNATVDSEGNLNPLRADSTVIVTAESEDGSHKAMCFVEIKQGIDKVELDKTILLMNQNSSQTLTFTVSPEDATDKKVIWTSSDETVATVKNGVITSKDKAGEAVIRATAIDNSEAYAECTVTVKQHVAGISFDKESIGLRKGEEESLSVIFEPADATDKRVTYSSENEEIALVDENGRITALSEGETVVKAVSAEGGFTAECKVKVYREITEISAEDLTIYRKEENTDAEAQVKVTVSPDNHDEALMYSSADKAVADVDENGTVIAKGPGETEIAVTGSISGKSCTFKVTVIQCVTDVYFDLDEITVSVGDMPTLFYNVYPSNADNKKVILTSSDSEVAEIVDSENGIIRALKAGTAVITVTTEDGEFTDTCTVTVK